jgi:hypothetical protein
MNGETSIHQFGNLFIKKIGPGTFLQAESLLFFQCNSFRYEPPHLFVGEDGFAQGLIVEEVAELSAFLHR